MSKVSKENLFFCGLSPPGKALLPPHTLPSLTRLASCLSSSPSRPHLLPLPANQISFKLFRSKREDFKVWIYINNIYSRHSSASVCQFVENKNLLTFLQLRVALVGPGLYEEYPIALRALGPPWRGWCAILPYSWLYFDFFSSEMSTQV